MTMICVTNNICKLLSNFPTFNRKIRPYRHVCDLIGYSYLYTGISQLTINWLLEYMSTLRSNCFVEKTKMLSDDYSNEDIWPLYVKQCKFLWATIILNIGGS